jgi:hypothetical protein
LEQTMTERVRQLFQAIADCAVVSCWHVAEDENASMWKAYAARGQGVAVQSTLSRLVRAFPDDIGLTQGLTIYVGLVQYLDFRTADVEAPSNAYAPVLWKKAFFRDERELRAVLSLTPGTRAAELISQQLVAGIGVPVRPVPHRQPGRPPAARPAAHGHVFGHVGVRTG